MSMISKQVGLLREVANDYERLNVDRCTQKVLRDAADTIEALSAKVRANNLHGGWMPVIEPPKKYGTYLVTLKSMCGFPRSVHKVAYGIIPGCRRKVGWWFYGDHGTEITEDVLAWQALPEPYKGGEDE